MGTVLNKIRVIQGWNILSPAETMPIATVWAEQLDRFNVPESLYDTIVDMCVDHRRKCLINGEQMPTLSIELFLAMFDKYSDTARKRLAALELKAAALRDEFYTITCLDGPFDPKNHSCRIGPFAGDHKECEEQMAKYRDAAPDQLRSRRPDFTGETFEDALDYCRSTIAEVVAMAADFKRSAGIFEVNDGTR